MMAQKKHVKTLKPSDLGPEDMPASAVRIVDVFYPSDTARAEIITGTPPEIATAVMNKLKEVV